MFQWRLKLREARLALSAGRVDEARRLLSDAELREFLPAKQLAGRVAEEYTDRARKRIAWGESAAGLADLDMAGQLAGPTSEHDAIRRGYARSAADEAIAKLAAGEPDAATERLRRTARRGVVSPALRDAGEVADAWTTARRLAAAGEMADATESLTRAQRLTETLGAGSADCDTLHRVADAVARELVQLTHRAEQHSAAREELHSAAAEKRWDEALGAVERTLRLAPSDKVALALRRRLWKELGLGLTASYHARRGASPVPLEQNRHATQSEAPTPMPAKDPGQPGRRLGSSLRKLHANKTTAASAARPGDTATSAASTDRRMLWIDAVGGFLVCLDNEVLLGQPSGGGPQPAVPILGDLSRRHAVLRREAGAYVLDPLGEVKVDGGKISGPTVLGDSHKIQLGDGVELKFTKPHALSATARLEVTSGHRTSPSADAVLLMADSCILGPSAHSHVRCRDWVQDVILFRKEDELCCRSTGPMTVDNAPAEGPAPIGPGSRVEGEDFALSVELV